MPGILSIYNYGALGVNVDASPIQLEDGELTKAQNAIHDPLGSSGGLRKRRGLVKVNSVAGAGSIPGAIGVPIAAGSAGNDGGLTPAPAVAPDTRTFIVGRRINATTTGWNTSTDAFATSPTTGGPDDYDANATVRSPDHLWTGMVEDTTHHKYRAWRSGRPLCLYRNNIFYAGNDYTNGTTAPTIRMWDGAVDYLIGRVPLRGATIPEAVIDMIVGGNDKIYFTVHDDGVYSSNTLKARIFELDPENRVMTQMGQDFPISPETVRVPYTLAWDKGRIWTRTHGGGISSVTHLVYYIRPGIDSAWTSATPEASASSCNVMHSFQGQLFMGRVADANAAATIIVRSPLAAYSTSLTVALTDASPSLVSFGYGNHFGAMATFASNLYAVYYNQRGAATDNTGDRYVRVYKYDGTTWTVVYNPAANDASAVPYNQAVVIGGSIYFISSPQRDATNGVNVILYSANGSSWSTVTSVLDNDSAGVISAVAS